MEIKAPILLHYILATAGHVDHGKSALVKALTGTDPDRLPEEKVRGITIDLGFAHLQLPSRDADARFLVGIVDVPGHEDFVKNMVAGIGSIDLALLVVAADDGWMPQTEEHLQIIEYLGIQRGVVALTKIDLVQDVETAKAAIRRQLCGTAFADAPIVPTSVISGVGLDELKKALVSVLEHTPPSADIGKPRLPVDRVFKLQGIGTVVTGTLTGGMLQRGQNVIVQPTGKKARIRTMQSHNRDVPASGPGTRTALNVPDLDAGTDVHRGDTITLESFGEPSNTVDAQVYIAPRATRPLRNRLRVRVHHGSADVAAQLILHGSEDLGIGERRLAQLQLEHRSFLFVGDRFILRDWAGQNTLAGGIVLALDTGRRAFREENHLRMLSLRAQSPADASLFVASEVAERGGSQRSTLLVKSRFGSQDISKAVAALIAERRIVANGDFVFDLRTRDEFRLRMIEAIDAHHRSHPERGGVVLSDLRATLESQAPVPGLFDAVVVDLCAGDFVRTGTLIRRKTHRPALSGELRDAGERLRSALAAKPFDPPSRKELAPDPLSQKALRFLVEAGEVIEINADVVMSSESVQRAKEQIRAFIRKNGPAATGELRQTLGSSRRVVIPLLERFDREGVTIRQNDRRTIRT